MIIQLYRALSVPRTHNFLKVNILGAGILLAGQLYAADDTMLNQHAYQQTVRISRAKITAYLKHAELPSQGNERIDNIVEKLRDIPYRFTGAMGEGDWQPAAKQYQPGAVHLDQDPVYRLDGLDCQTFVQMTMALLYANNLNQFDEYYRQIAYGALNLYASDQIYYANRNHFVEADFNRVNEARGFLQDVTSTGALGFYAKDITFSISKKAWFLKKQLFYQDDVRVFHGFMPHDQTIRFSYLPKQSLALMGEDGQYIPNQGLLDLIPAPAIAEIVNDPKRWSMNGRLMKDVIGTEMSVSHFGVLYRKTFHQGEVIYQRVRCGREEGELQCQVKSIVCEKSVCRELMFSHATDMYPSHFYWYRLPDGRYTCSSDKPASKTPYTTCNRVESLPFFNYLTNYQFGAYWYMNTPFILGVHVEKLIISPQNQNIDQDKAHLSG